MNKETIYDEQIAPLMDQIIAICKDNQIAMLASFSIPTDERPTLAVTTALLADEYEPPDKYRLAKEVIIFGKSFN